MGCWVSACFSLFLDLLPLLFPRTLVSSLEQVTHTTERIQPASIYILMEYEYLLAIAVHEPNVLLSFQYIYVFFFFFLVGLC